MVDRRLRSIAIIKDFDFSENISYFNKDKNLIKCNLLRFLFKKNKLHQKQIGSALLTSIFSFIIS